MMWKGSSPHSIISQEGYVVARYRTGEKECFRPSFKGQFIGDTFTTAAEAKAYCDTHLANQGRK